MPMNRRFILPVTLLAPAAPGGSGTSRSLLGVHDATEVAKRRELIDLQPARAELAIDEPEHHTPRQLILRRPR